MSNDMWFNNPSILLSNPDQFIPINKLSLTEKTNSLARLSIYIAIGIWVLNKEQKWYYLSIGLILFSYLMGSSKNNMLNESFSQYQNYKYINPKFNYNIPNNLKNNNIFSKYLNNTKPFNCWNNGLNDQTGFASWCYNDDNKKFNNLNKQSDNYRFSDSDMIINNNNNKQYHEETANDRNNIDIYFDKNKLNNLNDDTLNIKIHLI
jgi:hypothetical protein